MDSEVVQAQEDLGVMLNGALALRQWDAAIAFLHAGADPDAVNKMNSFTPLQQVIRLGHVPLVKELLAHGADPNLVSPFFINLKQTPLHSAARMGSDVDASHASTGDDQIAIIRLLCEHGADIEARTNEGYTPLMAALAAGHSRAGRALIGLGANPNGQQKSRTLTPVHVAASRGGVDEFNVAVWAGGDLTAKSPADEDAKAIILRRSHATLRSCLRDFESNAHYAPRDATKPYALAELMGADGEALLDQPAAWHDAKRMLAGLEARGESLGKAQILENRSAAGSWLGMAISCRALEPLMEHLARHGEMLTASDLSTGADGQYPTTELYWAADYQDLPKLMAHWKQEMAPQQFCRNLQALPKTIAEQLPIHQLMVTARRDALVAAQQDQSL